MARSTGPAAHRPEQTASPGLVANPPRPNAALLGLSVLLWLAWLGFLIWLAWRLT